MVHDLVIVGGGYWGTATAIVATQSGRSVLILDDDDLMSGSQNASGIVHQDIYHKKIFEHLLPPDWTDEELEESFEWLEMVAKAHPMPERFLNLDRPDLGVRPLKQRSLYLKSNDSLLALFPKTYGKAKQIRSIPGGFAVDTSGGPIYEAKAVLIACGYRCDELIVASGLPPIGVRGLFGRGLIVAGSAQHAVPITIQTAPYTKFELRAWGDHVRVGDTAEKSPNQRYRDRLDRLSTYMFPTDRTVVAEVTGIRPIMPQFTIRTLVPGLFVATGGHRSALGISGLVAKRVVGLL